MGDVVNLNKTRKRRERDAAKTRAAENRVRFGQDKNTRDKARKDAESVVQSSLEEQQRLVSQEEVVKQSLVEAERILEEARQQARQIRLEAEDYMDQRLAAFEATLTRTLEQMAQIREAQEAEANQTRLCAYMSAVVLAGCGAGSEQGAT
jgi:hypothetical protein